MDNVLKVTPSPHAKGSASTRRIMLDVIIALIPALIASVYYFGTRALLLTAVCVVSCVLFEFISRKVMKRENTIGDLSAVVTGLLLAYNLPSTLPIWMAVLGCAVAIIVVKQMFGGIGQNFVNPAIAGRIVLTVSFASHMTNWVLPQTVSQDAQTTATALKTLDTFRGSGNDFSSLPSLMQMFLGERAGCLGETCAAAILLGFIYLLVRRVISPVIPLCFVGTVAVIMLFVGEFDTTFVLYEVLSGGLLLGAVFMATDYTTSPLTPWGKVIFAVGCGIITCLIRIFGNLPEGVSFSIILMNILVPHIEKLTRPRVFGEGGAKK